jgi:NAD(P)-dependent dehydrogenase (short-subunit alcohol dehydrogenase family)
MKAAQLFDVGGLATIVTGAASGIGLAYAEVMADNGARVTLMDRDAASLDQAVHRLAERGGDVRGQTIDVSTGPRTITAGLTSYSPMSALIHHPVFSA